MRTGIPLCTLLVTSALLAACGGNVSLVGSASSSSSGASSSSSGASTGGSSASSSSSGGPAGDVTGTVVYRYLLADGTAVTQPADLSAYPIQAMVQAGGQWTMFNGTGQSDGSFTIPGVPQGPYVLAFSPTYLYTSARTLDLGSDAVGRPDAVYPMSATTMIAGNVQNLGAWSLSDTVEWMGFNAGGGAYGFGATMPSTGDTSLVQGEPAPWYGSLVDGTKGDVLYVTQLEQAPVAGDTYSLVTHFATFPMVQMTDGATTTVSGTFGQVTPGESVSLDFRASQFTAQAQAINPTAADDGTSLSIGTCPGAATDGLIGFSADLLTYYGATGDVKLGPMKYANPFPAGWGETLYAAESVTVSYAVPGATSPAYGFGSVLVSAPPMQAAAGPIQPIVTPVQDPTVDGKSAFGPLTGISVTPTLAWKPPATGKPDAYEVTVYQLQVASGTAYGAYTAELVTTDTSVTVPPGVLAQGSSYYFQITAVVKAVDFAAKPFAASPAYASADVLTSAATP